jgi:Chaperone of endosialidase
MVASIRTKHTTTPNSPPTGLQPGELAVELDTPTRLWVGVPGTLDPTQRKLLIDTSITAAPPYVLPPATTTTLGGVIPDGTTITVTPGGRISATGGGGPGYVLPPATTTSLGGVIPDGTTITVNAVGRISTADFVNVTGDTMTGPLNMESPGAIARAIYGTQGGVNRWLLAVGNINGDFVVVPYDDAGVSEGGAFAYRRASGALSLTGHGAPNGSADAGAPVAGDAFFTINKASDAGVNAIASATDGRQRWQIAMGNRTAETGANVGSDFAIQNFNDPGASIGAPLIISRATGQSTFSMPILETSSAELKTNVEPVESALSIIERLQGVFYNKGDSLKRQVGLIAEEVEAVLPEVVFDVPEHEDAPATLGIAYGNCVAVLVEALKELHAKVQALEAAR